MAIAVELSNGAQQAIRWTKRTLNHAYRMFEPAFDASLAYEFMGFMGPDSGEGVASHRERRAPDFSGGPTSE
jgi:enoyl-CoA hydratase